MTTSSAVLSQQSWNAAVVESGGSFLQAWEWGAFQAAYGRTVTRLLQPGWQAQCIQYPLPLGQAYLFIPYGPVFRATADQLELQLCLQQHAREQKTMFIRYERGGETLGGQAVAEVHPTHTWIKTLGASAEMEAVMKPKWRYNIKVAQRHEVMIQHTTTDLACLDQAYMLLTLTAQRQGIRLHPQAYYRLMLQVLGQAGFVKLYYAQVNAKLIAVALTVWFGDTVTYLHGGSDYSQRQTMAPHLLHWQIMQDAAAAGYSKYDFFGIAPADQPNHPWAGISRFKMGFGGQAHSWPGTYELPINHSWYTAYRLMKRLRS